MGHIYSLNKGYYGKVFVKFCDAIDLNKYVHKFFSSEQEHSIEPKIGGNGQF